MPARPESMRPHPLQPKGWESSLVALPARVMSVDRDMAEAPNNSICIVDDDDSVRDSLTVLLESHGYTVTTYGSGSEFLADQRRGNAACLIVDQHMPGLDGLGTIAGLHAEGISIPTILVCGRLDSKLAERAGKLQVAAILEKPFSAGKLFELMRVALHRPG